MVARELGIYDSTLGNWVRQDRIDRGEAEGLTTEERARLRQLEAENTKLRMERSAQTNRGLLGQGDVDAVSRHPLRRCPDGRWVCGGSRLPGGWGLHLGLLRLGGQRRAGSSRVEREQAELVAEIRTIHAHSGGTYGSPRITHELRRRGWRVNHKRVERLMAAHGLVGHRPRRRRNLTRADTAIPPAPDLLGRLFDPDRPDVAWCGDLTSIPTDEGWLYLTSVLDLASRHLVGWSMGEGHDASWRVPQRVRTG